MLYALESKLEDKILGQIILIIYHIKGKSVPLQP